MSQTTSESFNLKMSMLSLSEIELSTNNLNKILSTLEKKVDIAADFLRNSPVVINLINLPKEQQKLDFIKLNNLLRRYKMFPIGYKNATDHQALKAEQAGLIVIKEVLKKDNKTQPEKSATIEAKVPKAFASVPTKIIKGIIRSGQQVIAQGDLIIIGSVSATAEVLAVGNIHIYGSLRGRALAGIAGNADALIYCQKMQAELISIGGVYQLSENIQNGLDSTPILVQSKEGKIAITPIN
jgi:septum site-determining protein MinC